MDKENKYTELDNTDKKLNMPVVMLSCSKDKLIEGLKEALIGYQKDVGTYCSSFEFIQDKDFEEIAQDLIDLCN